MSDKNIRTGLRELQAVGPEAASHILGGLAGAKQFAQFAGIVLAYASHDSGQCRHCYPHRWNDENAADDAKLAKAVLTVEKAVISCCCNNSMDSSMHGWCANRNWTETNCSCECHCFVKRRAKSRAKEARKAQEKK